MLQKIEKYQNFVKESLIDYQLPSSPKNLYAPISYFLQLGGKRMRPVLTLMACEMFKGDYSKAKDAAVAIELFHNFTLIHDDIMDEAPLRRGKETVHSKWNRDIAILCGDALMIESYKAMSKVESSVLKAVIDTFNQTATEVCEGQQMDMDFENRNDVSIEEYVEMIRLKTAVLLGCSLKIGALIGGANSDSANELYNYGVNLGIAFQLQDDYLDVYADQDKFGKQVGGDIVAEKKTYLLIKAHELADSNQKRNLRDAFSEIDNESKVNKVKAIYEELGIPEISTKYASEFYASALENLNQIDLPEDSKIPLKNLAAFLLGREN